MPDNYAMRIYYDEQGGHTHLQIFAGKKEAPSFGCAGTIVLRNEEFAAWKDGRIKVQFLEKVPHVSLGRGEKP
jgi:hypothetical protein